MSSPLPPMLSGRPLRRRRSGSRVLGWTLGVIGAVLGVLLLIGFGADQQAHHDGTAPSTHTTQQG